MLRYTNAPLSNNNLNTDDNNILIFKDNLEIKLISSSENISHIAVFDMLGRSVYNKININSKNFAIDNILLQQQTLIVRVTLENGSIITNKIVY